MENVINIHVFPLSSLTEMNRTVCFGWQGPHKANGKLKIDFLSGPVKIVAFPSD